MLVAMRIGETPVPIPNTTVKTYPADGTALETVWESRWLPVLKIDWWFYSKRVFAIKWLIKSQNVR